VTRIQELMAPLQPFCDRVGANLINDKTVRLKENTVICKHNLVDYDWAVVATGASQNYFNLLGVEHAFSINTLEETKRARRFIEDKNPERIMIMGSGLTGVETACSLLLIST
jgi:NADH dehydrogenase